MAGEEFPPSLAGEGQGGGRLDKGQPTARDELRLSPCAPTQPSPTGGGLPSARDYRCAGTVTLGWGLGVGRPVGSEERTSVPMPTIMQTARATATPASSAPH